MDMQESMNETLDDLVMINNDRIAGYKKGMSQLKDRDTDLKAIFEQMIAQSTTYKEELIKIIEQTGGITEDGTTPAGKIYRAWVEIKSTFTEDSRDSILDACEFEENATQRAYESALLSGTILNIAIQTLVEKQTAGLKKSHDLIKEMRNTHETLQQS